MSGNPEQLNDANREFELINPSYAKDLTDRLTKGFQIHTVTPGLKFIGPTAYTPPGGGIIQNGPSLAAEMMTGGNIGNGSGDSTPIFFNVIGNPPSSGVPNPGAEPPVGPEERLRYSCLGGLCLQDPNGVYYGIDECLEAGCTAGGSSGGGGGGTSGGDGSGGGGSGGGGDSTSALFPCVDRAFHCTFAAMITGLTDDCPIGGLNPSPTCAVSGALGGVLTSRTYWKYKWVEVELQADKETWCTPLLTGNPGRSGGTDPDTEAYNIYEQNVDDGGNSVIPAGSIVTRKRIPNFWVVTMHVDQLGRAWFDKDNPIEVTCETALELVLDGGTYDGAS